jgi:hypothetical protein
MQPSSDAPGAGLALKTLAVFAVIVVFTSALGSYIGRHSTPEPTETRSPAPSAATPAAPTAPAATPSPLEPAKPAP